MTDLTLPAPLPCPFCGHVGLEFDEGSTFRWLMPSCGGCGASCGEQRIQTMGSGTREEWLETAKQNAIKEWNTRAAPCAAMGEVKGEAVAHAVIRSNGPDASPRLIADPAFERRLREAPDVSVPLFAAPVGKARMLTQDEFDAIWMPWAPFTEFATAIQRKFCEVNRFELQDVQRGSKNG